MSSKAECERHHYEPRLQRKSQTQEREKSLEKSFIFVLETAV